MKKYLIALFATGFTAACLAGGSTAPGVVQSGSVTAGHCAQFSANGVLIDSGVSTCGSGAAGVSQSTGTANQILVNGDSSAHTGATTYSLPSAVFLGTAGSSAGSLRLAGATSGNATIAAPASGGGTLTLPAGTDTLVGKATTDTFTNKSISGSTNTITNVPISTGISGLGSNVATALGINVGSAGAFVTNGGALGTPSSGNGANLTGIPLTTAVSGILPIANGGTGLSSLGSGVQTALGIAVDTAGGFCTVGGGACGGGGGGSGTVTSVSVLSANGFSGSVATSTTTPAITLSTTITGLLKGSSGALTAAVAGIDYAAPNSVNSYSTNQSVTSTQFNVANAAISTASVNYTFDATSTLSRNGAYTISNFSGTTTITPNAADQICVAGASCLSAGVATTIVAGQGVLITSPTSGRLEVQLIGSTVTLTADQTWTGTNTFGAVKAKTTTQSGTTYTFTANDCGTVVIFTSSSAVTATIPASIVPGSGIVCNIVAYQAGTGQVSVNGAAVTAATLVSAHSYTKTFGQYSMLGMSLSTISSVATAIVSGDGA